MALLLWPTQRGRRWVAQLLAVSLLTMVFAVAPVAMTTGKAVAETSNSWEQPDPCDITPLIPGPKDEVLIDGSSCGRNDNDFLDVRSPDGSLVWSLPHQANKIIRTDPVYDSSDNVYLLVWDEVANTYTVYSYDSTGNLRWSQLMPAGDWYNGWIHGMSIGSDGLLRVAGIATDGTVDIEAFGTDGTLKSSQHVAWPDGSGAGNGVQLFSYSGGLVMVQYDNGYVVYLSNSGSVLHDYRVSNPAGQWSGWGNEYAPDANGAIFLGGSAAICGDAAQPEQIAKVTPEGLAWTVSVDATCSTTENPGLGTHKLAALPDGGVAIAQEAPSTGDAYAEVINADGSTRWNVTMPYPGGPTSGQVADVRADTSGHVVVLSALNVPVSAGCNAALCKGAEVDTFDPASGSLLDHWLLFDPNGQTIYAGAVTSNTGIAYVDIGDTRTSDAGDLVGVSQSDLGVEYPATMGIQNSSSSPTGSVLPLYVALGDSYSSGEGAPSGSPPSFMTGTDVSGVNECHRSSVAYPELIANAYGLPIVFAACSGATIQDFYRANTANYGEPPQIGWLSPITEVVTLTIGGNDADFSNVMSYCAQRTSSQLSCQTAYKATVDADIQSLSRSESTKIDFPDLYQTIKNSAPNAGIFVLGYPRLFPNNINVDCDTGIPGRSFIPSDMAWINSEIASMDRAIESSATDAGLHYIDTYDAFNGHELCTSNPWINPAIPLHIEWSFHPTIAGQQEFAALVVSTASGSSW